uniref:Uncharacterized protein n=1 Tax=Cynoglossus semilaevis TaxID=244447 RepID=A0A3P8WR31_CYNSE
VTFTSKSSYLDVVKATVIGDECGDLLAVFNELYSHTFPDSRVGLLSLDTSDNAFGMGSSSEGVSLQGCAQMGFFVLFIVPFLLTTVVTELPGCTMCVCVCVCVCVCDCILWLYSEHDPKSKFVNPNPVNTQVYSFSVVWLALPTGPN